MGQGCPREVVAGERQRFPAPVGSCAPSAPAVPRSQAEASGIRNSCGAAPAESAPPLVRRAERPACRCGWPPRGGLCAGQLGSSRPHLPRELVVGGCRIQTGPDCGGPREGAGYRSRLHPGPPSGRQDRSLFRPESPRLLSLLRLLT